jgi:hypothetical protein
VDADRRIELRIRRSDDRGGGRSRRHAGDVYPGGVYLGDLDDMPRKRRDRRRFSPSAALVAGPMPVPTARKFCRNGLLRLQHETPNYLVGYFVHARSGREIGSRLLAPVQHHNERKLLS